MNLLRALFFTAAVAQFGSAATLAISTYLKDGLTPAGIASDPQGNVYIAGTAVTDPLAQTTGAVVLKVNPTATGFLYLTYLDSAASDQVAGIAVDGAGNAYIAGSTSNPNFPVVGGGSLGTAPLSTKDSRPFVMKLNPQGSVVFAVLLGGSATSTASGIALTPQGQILVSGMSAAKGFPSTSGAYSVTDTTNQWFLMELDAAADKVMFSATGIGGSSIALDSAGNIYMAGSATGTTYPTTPGAYQATFKQGYYCFDLCQIGFPGLLQHVTKVDPVASKLIYSTGLNDITVPAGSTTNVGLAVDATGNAYVTGTLFQAGYPFTVTAPTGSTTFLTKLDPAGANALFSVPVGGGGVLLDGSGSLYVGGIVTSIESGLALNLPLPPVAIPPGFSNVTQVCLPNYTTSLSETYVMRVDPNTGAELDVQGIDGSAPGATGITLAGGDVWITGSTPGPQVPFTPGVVAPANLGPGFVEGAYLSAVAFANTPGPIPDGPAIACVLDSGNLTHVGVVAPFQLISIFGANLGPAIGIAAPDGTDPSIAGVTVSFNGQPAQLLYVSSSQINVVVPVPPLPPPPLPAGNLLPAATVMQITVNGSVVERQFPFATSNLNLFANLSQNQVSCPNAPSAYGAQPLATNADGTLNSCANPAKYGSTVSFYLHGAGGFTTPNSPLLNMQATLGACSDTVSSASLIGDYVYKVDVGVPAVGSTCFEQFPSVGYFTVTLSYNDQPVGPFTVPGNLAGPVLNFSPPGTPIQMTVWTSQ